MYVCACMRVITHIKRMCVPTGKSYPTTSIPIQDKDAVREREKERGEREREQYVDNTFFFTVSPKSHRIHKTDPTMHDKLSRG